MSAEREFTGQTAIEGLEEWIKAEIRDSPRHSYDLGKFFFSVSAATLGALLAVKKLTSSPNLDGFLGFSICILGASMIVSLVLVWPRTYKIDGGDDLYAKYMQRIKEHSGLIKIWIILWVIGSVIGMVSVYK